MSVQSIPPAHPAAAHLRPQTDEEFSRLVESIRDGGYDPDYPVVIYQYEDGHEEILDGNHRYRAAVGLGITPPTTYWMGQHGTPERYVERVNDARRHETKEDRDARIRALKAEGLSNRAVAAKVGVSEPTVRRTTPGASRDAPERPVAAPVSTTPEPASPEPPSSASASAAALQAPTPPTSTDPPPPAPARVTGKDGKSYPASKPKERKEGATETNHTNGRRAATVTTPLAMRWERARKFLNEELLALDAEAVAASFVGDQGKKAQWTVNQCLTWLSALSAATEERARSKNPISERIAQ